MRRIISVPACAEKEPAPLFAAPPAVRVKAIILQLSPRFCCQQLANKTYPRLDCGVFYCSESGAGQSLPAVHGEAREGLLMDSDSLKSISIDELWNLHEQVTSTLVRRIADEKAKLEERLRILDGADSFNESKLSRSRARRPYPKVLPKYQNPRNPAERWSGRGKQPHWVQAQLRAGKKLEHFLIARSSTEKRRQAG